MDFLVEEICPPHCVKKKNVSLKASNNHIQVDIMFLDSNEDQNSHRFVPVR